MYNKLKKNIEYKQVYNYNKKLFSKYFVIFYKKSENYKIGIVASKKVGNAVIRNKVKRKIREILRINNDKIKYKNYDIVIISKKSLGKNINKINFIDIKNDLLYILAKLR